MQPLEQPDPETLRQTFDEITASTLRDFAHLPRASVGSTATRAEMETLLREPAPENGRPITEVLRQYQDDVAHWAMRPDHPRFWAFIPTAPTLVSVLGDWLCSASSFFCGAWLESAGPAQVELLVLDWFKEFLGYPTQASGVLTSGGSEANLVALVVAREGLSFEQRERAVIYLSDQRHWSVDRAAKIMGLRPDQLRPLPTDEHGRLLVGAVADAVRDDLRLGRMPWALVANAGSTNAGAVDPLDELASQCQAHQLWLHVDAAYGWTAALVPEGKDLLRGIERADSITLDPHKWFAQTFGVGCVLIRDGQRLPATFAMRPDYMRDVVPADDEVNFADRGLALTRRFSALKIWLSLKVLGVDWYRRLVQRCLCLADLAQLLLERAGCFEILHARQLSIVCFRYVPVRLAGGSDESAVDRLNEALCEELRRTGQAFLSTTRLHGRLAIRACFVNWRTTAADVEQVVELLARLGRELSFV